MGNFIGKGNRGFYVVDGFSKEYIDKCIQDVAIGVMSKFDAIYEILGQDDFSSNVAYYYCTDCKTSKLAELIQAVIEVRNRFGNDVQMMHGIPAHYGTTERLYFHLGDYSENDGNLKTKNPRYGKFYFPVAMFCNGKLEFYNTTGVQADDRGYFTGYEKEITESINYREE